MPPARRCAAYAGNDRFRLEQAAAMAEAAGMPLMAVNDVLYHTPDRRPLQDVLTAIRLNVPVAEAGFELRAECRTSYEAAGGDGAAVPPLSAGAGRDAALCREADVLARANSSTIIPTSRRNPGSSRRPSWNG